MIMIARQEETGDREGGDGRGHPAWSRDDTGFEFDNVSRDLDPGTSAVDDPVARAQRLTEARRRVTLVSIATTALFVLAVTLVALMFLVKGVILITVSALLVSCLAGGLLLVLLRRLRGGP